MDAPKKESNIASLPLINWASSLKRFNNDVAILTDLLAKLPDSLKESQVILTKAYKKKDTTALREELHRMLGAVIFFDLPRLKQATEMFQTALKAETQDKQQIESAYYTLNKTIDDFCEAYEQGKLEGK